MKIDYILSRIETSQEGGSYRYGTYPNDFKAGTDRGLQFNPFGPNMMAFTSPIGYEDVGIKVGDKLTVKNKKADTSGS